MVRGKVELRRIEDRASRQVSFSKRRIGLVKKAEELAVLCDAEVAVVLFSPKGKLYEYASPSSTEIIQRYRKFSEAERKVSKHVDGAKKHCEKFDPEAIKNMLEEAKRFSEHTTEEMSMDKLTALENNVEAALKETRSRKDQLMIDSIAKHLEKEKALRQQKKHLKSILAMQKEQETSPRLVPQEEEGDGGDVDGGDTSSRMMTLPSRQLPLDARKRKT